MDLLLEATARAEPRHFWFRGFRRFVRPLVEEATRGVTRPRLLDCGCGTAYNLSSLLEPHGPAFGIDLNAHGLALAAAAGRARGRLVRADVAAIPFPTDTFDVVTSFEVLYALPPSDVPRALREMVRVLRPGGALVATAAALPLLRGNHSVLAGEQQRFTRRGLGALLAGAGFRLERLAYTHAVLFPALLATRSLHRLAGLKPAERAGAEIAVPPAPVNAALSGMLALEATLARVVPMPIGSSLVCLARKPRERQRLEPGGAR